MAALLAVGVVVLVLVLADAVSMVIVLHEGGAAGRGNDVDISVADGDVAGVGGRQGVRDIKCKIAILKYIESGREIEAVVAPVDVLG